MSIEIYADEFFAKLNRTFGSNFQPKDISYRRSVHSHRYKRFEYFEILEICLLILIFIEHTFVFILTFKKKSLSTNQRKQNPSAVILPKKSFLYNCLHRNWIRAFSFSNVCLSSVYFIILILKHYHPNLIHPSSITFYSLPLNLLQQIFINFSTFHLFIISINVFQYFLRYYRLLKNTYSSYFFNGQNLLLTKHTNVALILSGSLALIFGYNFIFYNPDNSHTISLLPLITFNMILLSLINLIILSFIIICFIINICFKSNDDQISSDNEQENLRLIIEKNTCIKCYSKILEKNPNLFQDKSYSYRNLYKNIFPKHFRLSNKTKNSLENDFTFEQDNHFEINNLFSPSTLIKLNHQHSFCHLSYCLLLIFLFKYVLLTFPQYIIQMVFHLKQFYYLIFKKNLNKNFNYSLYDNNEYLLTITHFLLLLSRFGDSFLLIRLSYFIKKYFPCWCQVNSKIFQKKRTSQFILTAKNSESSNNEQMSPLDISNTNELQEQQQQQQQGQESIEKVPWQARNRRFRLKFQFVPLWSHNRPRLFKETI